MLLAVWKVSDRKLLLQAPTHVFSYRSRTFGLSLGSPAPSFQDSLSRKGFGSFHSEDVEKLIRVEDLAFWQKTLPPIYNSVASQCREAVDLAVCHNRNDSHMIDSTRLGRQLFGINRGSGVGASTSNRFNFLNHGAFGGALKPIMDASNVFREYCEEQPLRFFDRDLFPLVVHALIHLSRVLGCPSTELFPLTNVTTGVNCVLHSLLAHASLAPETTVVLSLSLTYGSTKKIIQHSVEHFNALGGRSGGHIRHQTVDIPLPVRNYEAEIVDKIAQSLKDDSAKRVILVLDAITSNTAMALPVVQIARACRAIRPDIVILVDAAHSLFAQDVQLYGGDGAAAEGEALAELVDFYLTNGHKWYCNAKGSAVLWAHPRHHDTLQPQVISHGYIPPRPHPLPGELLGEDSPELPNAACGGRLLSGFVWDGCRDYTSIICSPILSDMWGQINRHISPPVVNEMGSVAASRDEPGAGDGTIARALDVGNIRARNHALLMEARQLLMRKWGLVEADMPYPLGVLTATSPMTLVPVPDALHRKMDAAMTAGKDHDHGDGGGLWTDRHSFGLQEWLHHEARIEVPVKGVNGRGYFRISAHLYNDIDDYTKFGDVISSMC